jgi:hypothetical protein
LQKQEADAVFPGGPESYWTLGIGVVATIFAVFLLGINELQFLGDFYVSTLTSCAYEN